MAVDKPSASTPSPANEVNNNAPTLPAGFAYNAQNWLVMQPAGQDSPVKICSWLQVAARTRDAQGDNYGYLLDHCHGMNAANLADHLKQQSRQHYGSLALDWLRYLMQHSAQVRPVFQNVRQRFLASLPPESDGQVRRVAEKFALLASAVLLAIQVKVLDWPAQSVEAACLSQLNQWILARGGVAAKKTNKPFVRYAVLLNSMAKAALRLNKLVTAAKYANAQVGLILLARKPSTCFTQLAGVKPPKA